MKQNKTKQNKKYGLKWQSCGAKISSWEVRGSACYFVDIRGAVFFSLPASKILSSSEFVLLGASILKTAKC